MDGNETQTDIIKESACIEMFNIENGLESQVDRQEGNLQ